MLNRYRLSASAKSASATWPAHNSRFGLVLSTVKYLLRTEVHTFAFSVAANAILSFFPFVLLLMTIIRRVFHFTHCRQRGPAGIVLAWARCLCSQAGGISDYENLRYRRQYGNFLPDLLGAAQRQSARTKCCSLSSDHGPLIGDSEVCLHFGAP